MNSLVVPEYLADQIKRQEYEQKRPEWDHVERELKSLDERLSLAYIPARVPVDKCPIGAVPGLFHVRRDNSEKSVPDTYLPICNQNGEYADPDMGIIESLKKNDLWRTGALEDLHKKWEKEVKDREKRLQDMKDEASEEFLMRVKSKLSPSINFDPAVEWRNKKRARKG